MPIFRVTQNSRKDYLELLEIKGSNGLYFFRPGHPLLPHRRRKPEIIPISKPHGRALRVGNPKVERARVTIKVTNKKINPSSGPGVHPQSEEPFPLGINFMQIA